MRDARSFAHRGADARGAVDRIDRRGLHIAAVDEHAPSRISRVGRGCRGVISGARIRVRAGAEQLDLIVQRVELGFDVARLRILRGVRELRHNDRRQNAQDDHHDQNFDQRKTLANRLLQHS